MSDSHCSLRFFFFFFQAEDGIRDHCVTGVQTCALPIYLVWRPLAFWRTHSSSFFRALARRSEEHTSELQSHSDLVCRLLLEKKKISNLYNSWTTMYELMTMNMSRYLCVPCVCQLLPSNG